MKKSKLIIFLIIVILIVSILFLIFSKKTAKVFKNGKTKTSQEIVDYILNISSYNLKVTVEVISNKNNNRGNGVGNMWESSYYHCNFSVNLKLF